MSNENSFHPDALPVPIISFFASLHEMNAYEASTGIAAIDLYSGMVVLSNADLPSDEMVKVQLGANHGTAFAVSVFTHTLAEMFLVGHAQAQTVTQGGNAAQHYKHIQDHFSRKTGFGLE